MKERFQGVDKSLPSRLAESVEGSEVTTDSTDTTRLSEPECGQIIGVIARTVYCERNMGHLAESDEGAVWHRASGIGEGVLKWLILWSYEL